MAKKKVTYEINAELQKNLKVLAILTGKTVSELANEAIGQFLNNGKGGGQ